MLGVRGGILLWHVQARHESLLAEQEQGERVLYHQRMEYFRIFSVWFFRGGLHPDWDYFPFSFTGSPTLLKLMSRFGQHVYPGQKFPRHFLLCALWFSSRYYSSYMLFWRILILYNNEIVERALASLAAVSTHHFTATVATSLRPWLCITKNRYVRKITHAYTDQEKRLCSEPWSARPTWRKKKTTRFS